MIWNFFSSDVQSSVEEVVVGKEFLEILNYFLKHLMIYDSPNYVDIMNEYNYFELILIIHYIHQVVFCID